MAARILMNVMAAMLALGTVAPAMARQDASPTAGPTWRPPGLTFGAARQFDAPGLRLIGPMRIMTAAVVFDTEAHAEDAMPSAVDFAQAISQMEPDSIRPASAPKDLGDEAVAYIGEVAPEGQSQAFATGLLVWREQRLYTMIGYGFAGTDVLTELFALGRSISGRAVGNTPTAPVAAHNLWSGGVWDLLPTLADVPEGFVFESDTPISGTLDPTRN